jgi:hypothetical protein
MKKLLLGTLLLLSMSVFSQEDKKGTFVRKYTKYVITTNNVMGEVKDGDCTIVYNEDNTTNIGIYMVGSKVLLYSTGKIETGETTSGSKYQIVKCINQASGKNVSLQLFETEVRIFTNKDFSDAIEYFN